MDDDASVHMAAIERVWTFLAYATDPSTAIAGGLTMGEDPTRVWENGAVFNRFCKPCFLGTDLCDRGQAFTMEFLSTEPVPFNFYGGWWFFAFPLAAIRYWPFPFFVRGDDISFSIANDFNIVTLPGVISFQDQDFSAKESPQTLYLDLRNHLIHHLSLASLDIGLSKTLLIPVIFFARSLLQMHHDSMATLNLAIEDVMRGPEFFAKNADFAERRAVIAKMRQDEVWRPLVGPIPTERRWIVPDSGWQRMALRLTLNGLFLPFFGLFGNRLVLEQYERARVREVWGASEINYVNADRSQIMTVRHNKLKTLRRGLRMLWNLAIFSGRYRTLKQSWQQGYERLASAAFWEGQFAALDDDGAKADGGGKV